MIDNVSCMEIVKSKTDQLIKINHTHCYVIYLYRMVPKDAKKMEMLLLKGNLDYLFFVFKLFLNFIRILALQL